MLDSQEDYPLSEGDLIIENKFSIHKKYGIKNKLNFYFEYI